jgi:cytochrome c biogenesis protein CcmG, thiol:disulfide interchange protein DsbE
MWKFLLPIVACAALGVIFVKGLSPNRDIHEIPSPLIGKRAPDFALPDVLDSTKTVANKNFAGQVYVLNVWATWCGACRQEHPAWVEIAKDKTVPIIGLDWKDDHALAVQWLQQLGNPYVSVAYDPVGKTAIDFGVYGAPETFIVSGDGRVLYKHIAAITPEVWRKEFLPRIEAARSGKI